MNEELKPCPFCGRKIELHHETEGSYADKHRFPNGAWMFKHPFGETGNWNKCLGRNVNFQWFQSEQEAIDAWNTRADGWIKIEDALPELGPDYNYEYGDNRENEVLIKLAESKRVFIAHLSPNGYWWIDVYRAHLSHKDVTHWMPLPQPPKD